MLIRTSSGTRSHREPWPPGSTRWFSSERSDIRRSRWSIATSTSRAATCSGHGRLGRINAAIRAVLVQSLCGASVAPPVASYAVVADGELLEPSCLLVGSDPGLPIQASSSGTTGTAATAIDSFSAVATFTGSPRAAALAVAKAMPAPRATAVNVRPRICTARVNSGPNRNRVLTRTRTESSREPKHWLRKSRTDGRTFAGRLGRCPEPLDRWPRL